MTSNPRRNVLAGVLGLAALCAAAATTGPAQAHHSFAMFDRTKTETISGVVKEFEWTNPHSWIHMTVPDKDGKDAVWSFEIGGGPTSLGRKGWKRKSFAPGDKITMVMHPLRDGGRGGQLVSATTAAGEVLR